MQGTVEARSTGATQWQAVKLHDTYCPGDMLRVQDNSRADVVLANESVLRLSANTSITLEGVQEEQTSVVSLVKGLAHFFSRRPRSLEVRTPFTVAGVRGTEFFISVDDLKTFLSIFEGQVAGGQPGRQPHPQQRPIGRRRDRQSAGAASRGAATRCRALGAYTIPPFSMCGRRNFLLAAIGRGWCANLSNFTCRGICKTPLTVCRTFQRTCAIRVCLPIVPPCGWR